VPVLRDGKGLRGSGGAPRTDRLTRPSGDYNDRTGRRMAGRESPRQSRIPLQPRLLVGLETAAIVLAAAVMSGSMDQSNTTLVVAGFDPDRAQLITSLMIGAVVAAAVTLATARFSLAAWLGFAGAGALFGGTFLAETAGALGASGVDGEFDLGGWLLTLLALIVSGAVAGWAGAALGSTARPSIARALTVVKNAAFERRVDRSTVRYPVALALVLVLLVVAVPVFGDLVNYAPDSLMRRGAAPPDVAAATLVATGAAGSALPTTSATAGPTSEAPSPSAPPSGPARPWLAWLPTGTGQVATANMAAPWRGGTASAVDVTVYTPPGYDSAGSRRYPVLYEAPTGYHLWDGATNVKTALDALIDSGFMPATIVVFIDSSGGPFPSTECANSYDHREWYDTFVGQTVVGWVDGHYKTIADSGARAIAGMSEGGYCAAILALHHPTVFGTAISFSGYYVAGAAGGDSAAPFGGNKTLLADYSPTVVATQLATATRSQLHFIVIAKPDQRGYGPDAAAFEKVLSGNGYTYDAIAASEPHGWSQVRDYFSSAVQAWAAREVAAGVFSGLK
jgi:enterochelin esterase-like enzyme